MTELTSAEVVLHGLNFLEDEGLLRGCLCGGIVGSII